MISQSSKNSVVYGCAIVSHTQLTGEDLGSSAAKCYLYTFGFPQLSYRGTGFHNEELEDVAKLR